MKVRMGQFELETDEMAPFPTGVPTMPFIYVNASGATFVQTLRPGWTAPRVRHVWRSEALRLAKTYSIPGLAERLGHRTASYLPTDGETAWQPVGCPVCR